MAESGIFHTDFKPAPYWWEAYQPTAQDPADVPHRVRVAIVGGGYGGLATALETAKNGIDCVVLEAAELGFGASTRNGGGVSGGVNIGKSFSGKTLDPESDRARAVLMDGADAFSLIERLIAEEGISCHWNKTGRFVGAWTPAHYASQAKKIAMLNDAARSEAYMVPRDRQREEMASDYYYGGMVVERSANLHPALYYKGLLDACRARGVPVCARAEVQRINQRHNGWEVTTSRGSVQADEVVIATNGYTGDITPELKRRVVPLASHIIATEELPPDLAASLIPKRRTLADTRRVLCYYRMSPDGKRMIFGGRALHPRDAATKRADPPSVHDRSVPATARHTDYPCLDWQRGVHPRCPAAHGPAARHALSAWLQRQRRRDDDLPGLADGTQDRGCGQPGHRFRHRRVPHPSALHRQSLVSSGDRRMVPAA
jgi:glycine/D-amino acid oxidase-like deaminating enzyme